MLKTYLDEKLGEGQESGINTIYDCPFCAKKKFYVVTSYNKKDNFGVYHCFHCDASGSIIKLISSIDNVSYSEAKALLPQIDKYAVDASNVVIADATPQESLLAVLIMSQNQKEKPKEKAVDLTTIPVPDKLPPALPKGLKYIEDPANAEESMPFVNYLESRGFSWQEIVYNHIGYITHGGAFSSANKYFPINNHVVFFCYDEQGKYQYWNTRAIFPSNPKSINAPEVPDHLGKGDVIYNLYPALAHETVVLTEGVPDAMTIGENAVATYGKTLTNNQKALLVNNLRPDQDLIIMLDMDAWDSITALAIELYKYHENTYMLYNPTRQDANSLGKNVALNVIYNDRNLIKANPQGIATFEMLAKLY